MNVVIVGAGELGSYIASTLYMDKMNLIVVDTDSAALESLREKYDIMTVEGNGAHIETLRKARARDADMLMAVSGDEASNLLACKTASHLGVKETICRVNSGNLFSAKDDFTPDTLGVEHLIIPEDECVKKLADVVAGRIVLEDFYFSNPGALMSLCEVMPSSPVAGARLRDFPNTALLRNIRVAAVLRDKKHISPNGDTIIAPRDKLYIAGIREHVRDFVRLMTPDGLPASRSVIIAGTTRIAAKLAAKLAAENYDVRVLEEDYKKGESFLDAAGPDVNVIQGSSTEEEVLDEAGAANCDVFIGAHANDEKNIISCILAKQRGARKVTALTNKAEYINIVPAIETVDCGFNSSLVAVNKILMILGDKSKIDAMLPRINGCLIEFVINSDSPAKGKKISALNLPMSTVIALVFRKGKAIAATGDLVLERGDIVATIVKTSQLSQIESFFKIKDFFSL